MDERHRQFYGELIEHTDNWSRVTWAGHPIWQPVLDLWVIQETIFEVRPALIVECGTNRGGSALFYAHLLDLLGHGAVVTIDVERHDTPAHARITYLVGDSTDEGIAARVRDAAARADGPVMIILDSDHAPDHVARELALYHDLVTPGSYLLVQDGVIDVLWEPGPLVAIESFLTDHPEFELDEERCGRFLVTHHPKGWLRRRVETS